MATTITKSIGTTARDFSTIIAWESAQQGDLVTADQIQLGECYADSDFDELVVIDGSTTDATRFIHLSVNSAERHDGTANTGVRINITAGGAGNGAVITVKDDNTIIEWLEITAWRVAVFGVAAAIKTTDSGGHLFQNLLLHNNDDTNSGSDFQAIDTGSRGAANGVNMRIFNNIVYSIKGTTGGTMRGMFLGFNHDIYNNSIFDCKSGGIKLSNSDGSELAKNNIVLECSTDYEGTFDSSSSHNMDSDGTAPGASAQSNKKVINQFIRTTIGAEDLHLDIGSDAEGNGIGPTADSKVPSTDIDESSRSGATTDIGADLFTQTVNTKTVDVGGGGDFTSLSAWESSRQADLVTADTIEIAECAADATADTAGIVDINGWTTGSRNYIKIQSTGANKHSGTYNTSLYRLELTNAQLWDNREDFVRLEGLQFQQTSNTSGSGQTAAVESTTTASVAEVRISHCIIRGIISGATTGTRDGLHVNGASSVNSIHVLFNNIIYDWVNTDEPTANHRGIRPLQGRIICYNNTVHNCRIGFNPGSGIDEEHWRNNISNCDAVDSSFTDYSGLSGTTSNNISTDATSPDSAFRNKTISFVNEAGDDFHLAAGETDAIDQGADLSKDPQFRFEDDIDNDARPTDAWDIGADEALMAVTDLDFHVYSRGMSRGFSRGFA